MAGRKKVCEYKQSLNVACGQMTNTSVGIYVNKEKTSIIIGDAYWEEDDCEDEKKDRKAIEGYRKVGRICCDVWRWEATDLKTLGGKSAVDELKKRQDVVQVNAVHGNWRFEHYYEMIRQDQSDNENLYSKFDLIP